MKKLLISTFALVAIFFTILQSSCNETTSVGADILDQDQLNVAFIDTFSVQTNTVREDSVVIQAPDFPQYSFPIGIMDDPIMGEATSSMYVEFLPANSIAPSTLAGAIVDSVVLALKYDSTSYGNITTPRSLEVYRINQTVIATPENIIKGNVYSTAKYGVDATPIGVKNNFIARVGAKEELTLTSSIYLDKDKKDSLFTTKTATHLRILLDKSFGTEILALDSASLNTDSEFKKKFKGLWLKPTSKNQGMVNFFLNATTSNGISYNLLSNITIYYKDKDGRRRAVVLFPDPDAVKLPNYKHNFSNQAIQSLAKTDGDTLNYLQGLAGTNMKVKIPNLKKLKNSGIIINKAELECYAMPTKDDLAPSVQLLAVEASNGRSLLKKDAELGGNGGYTAFGGKPITTTVNGVSLKKYVFNLSYFVQKEIDEITKDDTFYLTTIAKNQRATRTIIYGSKHPKYAPKLKLYYTKIK